jgi:hypothetical protein
MAVMSLRRVLGVWLALCVAMVGNGIFREAALVPVFRRAAADVLSAALGIGIVLAITRLFLRGFAGRPDARPGQVAVIWLGVTVAFEFLFGHFVDGKSWGELAGNYALWRGRLWPVVLAFVGLAPFVWLRWWPARGADPNMTFDQAETESGAAGDHASPRDAAAATR